MKENTFQYTVVGLLAAIFLLVIIGLFTKKKKTEYGTSISIAGKTVYENKKLKDALKKAEDEETKKAIIEAHSLSAKELTKKAS